MVICADGTPLKELVLLDKIGCSIEHETSHALLARSPRALRFRPLRAISPPLVTEIDRVLYPLQQVKVMGFLRKVQKSKDASIERFTELSIPEISRTVTAFEESGYGMVWKERRGRYPDTIVKATDAGRTAMRKMVGNLRTYSGG